MRYTLMMRELDTFSQIFISNIRDGLCPLLQDIEHFQLKKIISNVNFPQIRGGT